MCERVGPEYFWGIAATVVTWGVDLPTLAVRANYNEITPLAFLMLIGAWISMIVAGISVFRGKRGLVPFSLYIAFAVLACLAARLGFVFPLATGVAVAIGAIIWPVPTQLANKPGTEPA